MVASTLINSKTFCSLPFCNLSLGADGHSRVCCNVIDNNKELFVSQNNLNLHNSGLHKQIRKAIAHETKHVACQRCWDVEDGGGESYRQIFNSLYRNQISEEVLYGLKEDGSLNKINYFYMDITLGNQCTLRCRMCHPLSSHLWDEEAAEFGLFGLSKDDLGKLSQLNWYNEDTKKFLLNNMGQVDRLNFLGGEPLIMKNHIEILEQLISIGRASFIDLQYNSNLTHLPPDLKRVWSAFKSVEVNLSCDGFGSLNEYIRYPLNWKNWIENVEILNSWKSNVNLKLSLHSTFQVLNLTQSFIFNQWAWDFMSGLGWPRVPFYIYVSFPNYYNAQILPDKLKKLALLELEKYESFLANKELTSLEKSWFAIYKSHYHSMMATPKNETELWNRFVKITRLIDSKRGDSILNVLPEFKDSFA